MTCNKNENSLPVNNSSGQTTSDGSSIHYSEMFANCKISKCTANFLACIKQLHDLSNSFHDALMELYGEEQADKVIEGEFCQKRNDLESVLFRIANDCMTDYIISNEMNEI